MRRSAAAALGLLAASFFFAACRRHPSGPQVFVPYSSASGDFECAAPLGWRAETSADADAYRFTVWLGPEDKEALWGAPRFVVAWYAAGKPVRKASGETGKYASIDDYIAQMAATVWGPDPAFSARRTAVTIGGRPAERMVVRVQKDAYMNLPDARPAAAGGGRMWREDEAVFVPTRKGFYTIVFPSSADARPRYEAAFQKLIDSLRFTKESPVDNI
ncbi:MAG: hypothetical protein NTX64_00155 [Elusimicrobia bacterium]|nr:hypothetical protein [Elusimicrobiota bacterium]